MTKNKAIRHIGLVIAATAAAIAMLGMSDIAGQSTNEALRAMSKDRNREKATVIWGYVTSWSKELPNPFLVTHLSYAFATIDNDFKSLTIKNEPRFKEIVNLKKVNPKLKVTLSIGGWGASNFSEMAYTETSRAAFIANAMKIVREHNLDGLDIDWEFPGSTLGVISSSKNDKSNFTELMKQLRDSLGDSRLLSFASPSYSVFFNYKDVAPYVDFVNVMTYDISVPPRHHSPLNHSNLTGKSCVKDVIAEHFIKGVPADKIVLGIPFYGRGNEKKYAKFQDYRYIRPKDGTELRFDSVAMAPYIADKETGELLISFDDTTSVKAKCKFVKETGIRGVMIWHYCGDTKKHELLNTINSELY